MDHSIEQVTLLPWQSTVLTWAGGATLALLLLALMMMLFFSSKKKHEEKLRTIVGFVFLAFIISAVLSSVAAISFLVDVELGWKLSLLAGVAVILNIISTVAMPIVVIFNKPTKFCYLWMILFVISFATVINLVIFSLGGK